MRWSTSVRVTTALTSVLHASAVYACPLCYGSSTVGVLRAYLVSAFFMIALAWIVIGAVWLYAARLYPESAHSRDLGIDGETRGSLRNAAGEFESPDGSVEIVPENNGGKP